MLSLGVSRRITWSEKITRTRNEAAAAEVWRRKAMAYLGFTFTLSDGSGEEHAQDVCHACGRNQERP